ncbi:MAG: hypothetical protein JSV98_06320 [candidate division WOR-3 bacterium]|nr:MAG: hypothetical protein JSV98_06320 [candidate division WOR-3 bacterium]
MKQRIEDVLDELISEVARGKTIGDCMSKYPQHEEELRSLLELATSINEVPKPEPDAEAVRAAVRRLQISTVRPKGLNLRGFFTLKMLPVRAIAAFLVLFILEVTTVSLSAKSLPGHFLYPVKRFAEDVQHVLTLDSEGMVRHHVVLAGRRTNEWAATVEPDIPLNCVLLDEMLQEISHAIGHLGDLDAESAARLTDLIYECHLSQVEVLERAKECACPCNVEEIEKALKHCMNHSECLECIKYHLESGGIRFPSGT